MKLSTSHILFDRLAALKKSGEENWKKRVTPPKIPQVIAGVDMSKVKLREKPTKTTERPTSIADRLSALQDQKDSWKNRVEEKDVEQFTVQGKLNMSGMT